jgi:hypothetical protein
MKTLVSRLIIVVLALAVLWLVTREDTSLSAQDNKSFDSCSQLLTSVAEAIQDCSDLNSNWACYGSEDAGVDPPEYRFQALSDRRPLEVLKRIDTYYEGTVLMNLQVEGQTAPIKAVLFGPTEVTATKPGAHDFLMRIDDQNMVCRATPPGMVISTESGQTGQIKINGIDIKLGSTAFTTAAGDNLTTIANLEGHVTVTIGNESVEIPVGYQVQVDGSGGQLRFVGPPTPSEYFDSPLLQWIANDKAGLSSMVNTNKEKSARACTQRIEFGQTVEEQITNSGQECLFQFCANAGDTATVAMTAVDGKLDPWVDLQTPDKALFAFNNDIGEQSADSLLCNVQLPVSSCDYTIVARSDRNRTAGKFRLTLDKQTGCQQPTPRCAVVSRFGAQLYKGPGTDNERIQKLEAETHMVPKGYSADGNWIEVAVGGTERSGWVKNDARFVQCEITGGPAAGPAVEPSAGPPTGPVTKSTIKPGGSTACTPAAGGKYPISTTDICESQDKNPDKPKNKDSEQPVQPESPISPLAAP